MQSHSDITEIITQCMNLEVEEGNRNSALGMGPEDGMGSKWFLVERALPGYGMPVTHGLTEGSF